MKKLDEKDLPKAWLALHEASARRLLRTESKNILALRTVARQVHHELLSKVGMHPTRTTAIAAVVHARKEMAERVATEIRAMRTRARMAALDQVRAELALLVRQLPPKDQASVNADKLAKTDHEADAAAADTAATSLAAAWASAVLQTLVPVKEGEEHKVEQRSKLAMQHLDSRVKRIGATETAAAYNDQHEDAVEDALEDAAVEEEGEPKAKPKWFGWLFRYWSAILDRKTCAECRAHDGEIVSVGMRFSGGDEPGDVHPFCRCVESLVFLPVRSSETEEEGDDEQEAGGA